MIQKIDQIAAAADIAAQNTDGLRQRPHLDLDAPIEPKVIDGTAPGTAQNSRRMGVVHHHDGAIFLGQFHQRGQRTNVAFHRKYAVGDQQLVSGNSLERRQLRLRRLHIAMREDVNLRPRQPAAVDDTGVVQGVGNDVIFRCEDGRHRARIGRESGLKNHARFHILERRNLALQFQVQVHGAGDSPHRARPRAVLSRRLNGRFYQLGVRGQAKIVVRSEVDYLPPVESRNRSAGGLQLPQPLEGSGLPPRVQLIGQEA